MMRGGGRDRPWPGSGSVDLHLLISGYAAVFL